MGKTSFMKINIIASGSQGNTILISHNGYHLLLDAGVKIDKLRKALLNLHLRLTSIDAVLISHSHDDHSSTVKDLWQVGIECFMAKETAQAINFDSHRLRVIEAHKQFSIGPWTILPFDLIHDVPNLGFLIAIDNKKVLYAIDTPSINYLFNDLTHILIECNYDIKMLKDNFCNGEINGALRLRILRNHMNLNGVKLFLIANDLNKIEEIYLLHISKQNGDPKIFKDEIQRLTGKVVKIK